MSTSKRIGWRERNHTVAVALRRVADFTATVSDVKPNIDTGRAGSGGEQTDDQAHTAEVRTGGPDVRTLSLLSTGLHAVAVVLSAVALLMAGPGNPAIGFQLAVGIVAMFGVITTPPYDAPTAVLRTMRGQATHGGMRQGVVIKAMFAVALLYNGWHPELFGIGDPIVPSLLLGLALAISAVGTGLTARAVTRVIESRPADA